MAQNVVLTVCNRKHAPATGQAFRSRLLRLSEKNLIISYVHSKIIYILLLLGGVVL